MFEQFEKDVLNTNEACKALNISRSTLYHLVKSGELAYLTPGIAKNAYKFPKKYLEDYINTHSLQK